MCVLYNAKYSYNTWTKPKWLANQNAHILIKQKRGVHKLMNKFNKIKFDAINVRGFMKTNRNAPHT